MSGRHQISADGKHLIDGVAFGRPFLRRTDRPVVRIPPRKRRCITYDAEDDLESGEEDGQVVVRAGLNSADDVGAGDDSEDNEDYTPNDNGQETDLRVELKALQQDAQHNSRKDDQASNTVATRRYKRSPKGLGLLYSNKESGQTLDVGSRSPLVDQDDEDEDESVGNRVKRRRLNPARASTRISSEQTRNIKHPSTSTQQIHRRDSAGSAKSVHFEDSEATTPITIREADLSEEEDDDFHPDDINESDKENAEPFSDDSRSNQVSSVIFSAMQL